MTRFFLLPVTVSVIILFGIWAGLGFAAFVTAVLLVILEITLSFDNAVVNARVLSGMNEKWRNRFLTWGILIAVFGTRLVLPILIVSASVLMSPWAVTMLAAFNPSEYAHLLEGARYSIYSFGAAFLLMVSLKYFLNDAKDVHWFQVVERHLARWGRIEAIEIGIALSLIAIISFFVPAVAQATVLMSGLLGVLLFILTQGITSALSVEVEGGAVAKSGLALFLYLEVLDAAFSLDSVIGAFALTTSLPIIIAGLGIGAWFVRSITIYLVQRKTLETLTYLEHGAHWAILGLAGSMFADLLFPVPEVVTGTIGLAFILAAYWSSLRARKNLLAATT
ncbi:DUF475 domain-containing protein [Patescibacteria group bacterium]|nr:DUF475 domain-containing protein [Patescibacteria group bacterium]MBU1501038.1 DUF475 domain-containing protein [Patescibacteria group bacterium]MBU2080668.1 DUF475 domain-containing protein [Patescibacteria group bacterium]MBU2124257.1 DUF475 domain-containing protein [Patescibacteria group bacterium]MBU2194383.1 DUF475 domain-containing protein [Patescibacteria group bacterium]